MEKYRYKGKKLNHENLSAFLLSMGKKGHIPYDGRNEEEKEYEYDSNNNIINTTWRIEYSGGWGLGYNSCIKYDANSEFKWTVGFVDDPPLAHKIINELPSGESFGSRGSDYDYSHCGFELMNDPDNDSGVVVLSSNNLEKIIEFPFYYGLYMELEN